MAIMTDLLRLMLRDPMPIDVIFNFNGGEDAGPTTSETNHFGLVSRVGLQFRPCHVKGWIKKVAKATCCRETRYTHGYTYRII